MESKPKVIGIGELLWDVLPEGKKLGGAPCNFVYHAQKQGADGLSISAIGDDENGKEILEVLKEKGISSDLIQINQKPTSTVDVKLNEQGVPEYIIHEDVAWDYISYTDQLKQEVSSADIICFGSLAQRNKESRKAIKSMLMDCSSDTLIVCDINLRQDYYTKDIINESLQLCNVLKLNEGELPVVCDLLDIHGESEEEKVQKFIDAYKLKLLAFTKGSEGSLLMTSSGKSYLETPKVDVKDTVGAGDSFTAVMIMGLAKGEPLKQLHQKAVDISAFVCTQNGAMPDYKEITTYD